VLWCGASLNLNFSYNANEVPDGTVLSIVLAVEDFFANDNVIATLGSVVAPAKEFLIQFPNPFPTDWLGSKKLKDNAGSGEGVTIEIMSADKKISSYCTTTVSDPEFTIKCCPSSEAAKCGCDKCSCATGDQCSAGLACESDGKCAIDLPGVGELCQAGLCERSLLCKCPETNPQCAVTEKLCFGACPVGSTAPGKLNCPCNKGMCEAGLACSQSFCRPSATTPIATTPCQPSVKNIEPDACMQHPSGVTPVPHSCQTGRCAPCTPGATLCTCNSGQCSSGTDSCLPVTALGVQQLRCYPRTGCLGCPCTNPGVENSCQDGICISAICTRMLTPPPTQAVVPVPPTTQAGSVSCTQKPGGNGCDCLKQGNQVGCGEMGLVCNKGTNKCQKPGQDVNAAQVALPASAALLVGLATLL
jgi:hypothetical protein